MTDFGPCAPWDVQWTCDVMQASPAATGQAVAAATEILWSLTGRQYGLCPMTLRPCRSDCGDVPWGWVEWPGSGPWPRPALIGGLWFNLTCGYCMGGCSCSSVSEVILPAPVASITQVKVNGTVLSPTTYRLDDDRRLVRIGATWPLCNDLNRTDAQTGTWSVAAMYGQDVPIIGRLAAGELACEFLKAMNGEDCRLPSNVTSLVRQGVSISMPNPQEVFTSGMLNLYFCDLFIRSVNPGGLVSRSQTYVVDDVLGGMPRRVGP